MSNSQSRVHSDTLTSLLGTPSGIRIVSVIGPVGSGVRSVLDSLVQQLVPIGEKMDPNASRRLYDTRADGDWVPPVLPRPWRVWHGAYYPGRERPDVESTKQYALDEKHRQLLHEEKKKGRGGSGAQGEEISYPPPYWEARNKDKERYMFHIVYPPRGEDKDDYGNSSYVEKQTPSIFASSPPKAANTTTTTTTKSTKASSSTASSTTAPKVPLNSSILSNHMVSDNTLRSLVITDASILVIDLSISPYQDQHGGGGGRGRGGGGGMSFAIEQLLITLLQHRIVPIVLFNKLDTVLLLRHQQGGMESETGKDDENDTDDDDGEGDDGANGDYYLEAIYQDIQYRLSLLNSVLECFAYDDSGFGVVVRRAAAAEEEGNNSPSEEKEERTEKEEVCGGSSTSSPSRRHCDPNAMNDDNKGTSKNAPNRKEKEPQQQQQQQQQERLKFCPTRGNVIFGAAWLQLGFTLETFADKYLARKQQQQQHTSTSSSGTSETGKGGRSDAADGRDKKDEEKPQPTTTTTTTSTPSPETTSTEKEEHEHGQKRAKLASHLWGDWAFDQGTKKWIPYSSSSKARRASSSSADDTNSITPHCRHRSFVTFCLKPLAHILHLIKSRDWIPFRTIANKNEPFIDLVPSCFDSFDQAVSSISKIERMAERFFESYLPLSTALCEAIVKCAPSPVEAQRYRAELLYGGAKEGNNHRDKKEKKEGQDDLSPSAYFKSLEGCQSHDHHQQQQEAAGGETAPSTNTTTNTTSSSSSSSSSPVVAKPTNNNKLLVYVSELIPLTRQGRWVAVARIFSGSLSLGQTVDILLPPPPSSDDDDDDGASRSSSSSSSSSVCHNGAKIAKIVFTSPHSLESLFAAERAGLSIIEGGEEGTVVGIPAGNLCIISGLDRYCLGACTLIAPSINAPLPTHGEREAHLKKTEDVVRFAIKDPRPTSSLSLNQVQPHKFPVWAAIEPVHFADLPKVQSACKGLLYSTNGEVQEYLDEATGAQCVRGKTFTSLEAAIARVAATSRVTLKHGTSIEFSAMPRYLETITKPTPQGNFYLSKSPNKQNRIQMRSEPLSENLVAAMRRGEISGDSPADPKERAMKMAKQFSWRPDEARKIWYFAGCGIGNGSFKSSGSSSTDQEHPNILVDLTRGSVNMIEIKDSTISATRMFCQSGGILAEEPIVGMRLDLLDATLHADAIHRGAGQIIPTMRRGFLHLQGLCGATLMEPVYYGQVQIVHREHTLHQQRQQQRRPEKKRDGQDNDNGDDDEENDGTTITAASEAAENSSSGGGSSAEAYLFSLLNQNRGVVIGESTAGGGSPSRHDLSSFHHHHRYHPGFLTTWSFYLPVAHESAFLKGLSAVSSPSPSVSVISSTPPFLNCHLRFSHHQHLTGSYNITTSTSTMTSDGDPHEVISFGLAADPKSNTTVTTKKGVVLSASTGLLTSSPTSGPSSPMEAAMTGQLGPVVQMLRERKGLHPTHEIKFDGQWSTLPL